VSASLEPTADRGRRNDRSSGDPDDAGSDEVVSDEDDVGSEAAEEFIRRHDWLIRFGRIGWAAKGVVYLLIGVLAFTIAAKPFAPTADGQADPSGAVATIAQQPFGGVLMWVMALGLLTYAAWRIVTVLLPARLSTHALARRVGYTASALTYLALALTAVSLARRPGSSGGSGRESQDAQVAQVTRSVMEWTGGRWLVGLAGLVVIGVGLYFLYKGVSASFEDDLEHRSVGPFSWTIIRTMGRVGWVGRAVMMALIGVFLVAAAIDYDPSEARGLDDSLRRVADSSIGVVLVYVVAIGLVLYGAYCIVSTPARRLVATDDDAVDPS
jgi:hypothetical protein